MADDTALPLPDTGGAPLASVLIVDDEVELAGALRDMLARHRYKTLAFNNGHEALEALKTQSFEVMLVDLMMPEMDGITLLKAALEIDPHLVAIVMTGQGTVQTAVDAMKSGASDYVMKPFKLNTILAALNRTLEVRRLRLENVQLKEMLSIYELGQLVASTLDVQAILGKTAEAALNQVLADEVSILLPTENPDEMVVAATRGEERSHLVGERVPLDGTIAGWVAKQREALTLDGEVQDERFTPVYPRSEIYSSISMPMLLGNRLIGVMNINMTSRPRTLTQGQMKGLSILANITASAIENARLYEETEKRLHFLSSLHTIDQAISSSLDLGITLKILLDQVATQLEAEAAAVFLANPATQNLEYADGRGLRTTALEKAQGHLHNGIASEAVVERKIVSLPDLRQHDEHPLRDLLLEEEGIESCFIAPLVSKGEVEGVLEVFRRAPFQPDEEWNRKLETLAGQAAIAIDNARLLYRLQRSNQQLRQAYNATIEGWSRALDLRDRETEGHTLRVTEITVRLAQSTGLFDDEELLYIRWGALLHDIGKMGVPDTILHKPGRLTEEEWEIMKKHPKYAYDLLSPVIHLRKALDIPRYHHERWDGSGYPYGLAGDRIPLAARLFSVVDVWDALRYDRHYRQGWAEEQVIQHLRDNAGTQFDPQAVDAFLKLLEAEEIE